MEKIFGIDLGTTNSEIACVRDGVPVVIRTEGGEKYIPSVVGVAGDGEILVGFKAKNQYAAYPEKTVASIKRKMGSGERVRLGEKEYSPPEISAEILKYLKNAAERETGLAVKKAVITVPAYFGDRQRQDTMIAGELAGLEVVRIINEPTAAALAYQRRRDAREKILVYDMGGGTFDISLIDAEGDVVEVLATDGNTRLGGDDFDEELRRHFVALLPEGAIGRNDLVPLARLKNIAESTKIRLSTESRVAVKEPFITSFRGKPVNLEASLSRREFEERVEGYLTETFSLMDKVLKAGRLRRDDVDRVLLVGGSTYIPAIMERLTDGMGFTVHREIDPMYCVALGAAVQGAIIAGEALATILVDVNSHSLGIRCVDIGPLGYERDDYYSIVIRKNTPIPASLTKTFYTLHDGQKTVAIDVYQGEDPRVSANTFLGSFSVENLPKKLKADSEMEVTFDYNLNGIVEVRALEPRSGRSEKLALDVNRLTGGEKALSRAPIEPSS
jgi:molecular chaperone DnaK